MPANNHNDLRDFRRTVPIYLKALFITRQCPWQRAPYPLTDHYAMCQSIERHCLS